MDEILIDLLRSVVGTFQTRLHEMPAIRELELTPFQARLLSVIGRYPEISQLTLAAETDRDKAQIARAIKELKTRGLVTQSGHKTDWRTQCLSLTEEGARAAARLDGQRSELIARALGDCSDAEKEAMCRTLRIMRHALG